MDSLTRDLDTRRASGERREGRGYALYVLALCLAVYISSTADRQILSVLAQAVKKDLHLSDADLGFLLGTSFAVFYAVFGIAAGRLADVWSRKRLVAAGLLAWSGFTMLSGAARSFLSLGACRIGVGVGESTSSPAIYSILYDVFSARWRSTVFAIYSAGVFVGAGTGMAVGGVAADLWARLYPDPASAPLGLKAWQAAFVLVGLPGLALAAAVSRLREATHRAGMEGSAGAASPAAPAEGGGWRDVAALLPLVGLIRLGELGGPRALLGNALLLVACAAAGFGLGALTRDYAQWAVMGLGVYCCGSAAQVVRLADPETFRSVIASRVMVVGNLGVAGCVFLTNGLLAWLPAYMQRGYGVSAGQAGTVLGLSYVVTGLLGSLFGGVLADQLGRRIGRSSRLATAALSYLASLALVFALARARTALGAYAVCVPLQFAAAMYLGPCAAHVNSLAPPRMRALASSFYIATLVFVGLAVGPYVIGRLSDLFAAHGASPAQALRGGFVWSLWSAVPTLACLGVAIRWLRTEV
jgi:MFS family permease